MQSVNPLHLGLVIRSGAYAQRSPRTQLDVALLAATLDFRLSLYFVGEAVLQLAHGHGVRPDTSAALLPPGYRAWASLPGLFERSLLEVFAEPHWLDRMQHGGLVASLQLQAMTSEEMRSSWNRCDRVLVL
jgi:sulfur relay (sulfurtransferase) DsrF/TusC family protein